MGIGICFGPWLRTSTISLRALVMLSYNCQAVVVLLRILWFYFFSVIQFCSTAFAYYAQATAAQEIFGHTLQSLRGIKYLYK